MGIIFRPLKSQIHPQSVSSLLMYQVRHRAILRTSPAHVSIPPSSSVLSHSHAAAHSIYMSGDLWLEVSLRFGRVGLGETQWSWADQELGRTA